MSVDVDQPLDPPASNPLPERFQDGLRGVFVVLLRHGAPSQIGLGQKGAIEIDTKAYEGSRGAG